MKPTVPSAARIRRAREQAGLTRHQAGTLVYRSVRSWEKFENGERPIDPAVWELFERKVAEL